MAAGYIWNKPYRIGCKKFAGLPSIGIERAMQMSDMAQEAFFQEINGVDRVGAT